MPGRYEIVDEPEAMEIADDDVYHPDLTVSGSTSAVNSFRTLEPVIAGPIGLKTIFYSPRWSETQKKVCLGLLIFISIFCLALFISLIVGLFNVISEIHRSERMRQSGLFIVPNLIDDEAGIFYYDLPSKGDEYKKFADEYISQIESFLAQYNNQSSAGVECPDGVAPGKGQICRFDTNLLGQNCTSENKFGYYDGNPCLLFGLRKLRKWRPEITMDYLSSLNSGTKKSSYNVSYTPLSCSAKLTNMGGRDFSFGIGSEYFDYYPSEGFKNALLFQNSPDFDEKSQLKPLVFVQLKGLQKIQSLLISCSLLAKNVKELDGLNTLHFEYKNASQDSDIMDDNV